MKLNFTKLAWRVAVALMVAAGIALYLLRNGASSARYITAEVTRGPIIRAVIATGTVNPVTTVQVGTYDSGPIQAIYADFNASVKAGQLIAKLDPRPYQVKVDETTAAVANAKAQLAKDTADLAYKKVTFARDRRLRAAEVISQDVLDSATAVYAQALGQVALDRANVQQQVANLHDAQVNLNYTNIISPVDGTVVSRNVDVGQTVAASFQTPTLFLIAKDLTRMQVDTNVSESDVGNVSDGQTAAFKVDAFPDREFDGIVTQVRQAPITVQNVVTYDVVVTVANPELLLKPGMTANVTIVSAKRADVTRVPVQALRFSPKRASGSGGSTAAADGQVGSRARVWIPSGKGIAPVAIMTGLDDGNNVELLSGRLKPGDLVVTDELRTGGGGAPSGPSTLRLPR